MNGASTKLPVAAAVLVFLNSVYFAGAYLTGFGSFGIGEVNLKLSVVYALLGLATVAGVVFTRGLSRGVVKFLLVAAVVCLLWTVALISHLSQWELGLAAGVIALALSGYLLFQGWSLLTRREPSSP